MIKFRELVENILYNNLLLESEQKVNWILSQPKLVQALESRIQNDSKVPDGITVEQLLKDFDNKSIVIEKFLPWVAKMYSKNEFEYTDLELISNYLQNFIKNSSKLEKRDINQYKSLEELNAALESIKDIKGSREAQRDAKANTEKIYEDNKWIILIPHTKEAAIQYGKGTKWCTAGVNDNMFDYYSKDGPLYIIINKVNPSEKYQFHFETNQYKNAEDNDIDLSTFLKENPEITKFFRNLKPVGLQRMDKSNYLNWIWFNPEELTKQDCIKAVKNNYHALKYIPEELKDYDMYLTAVKNDWHALKYIPEEFKDYKLYLTIVETNGSLIKFVPKKYRDYDMYLAAVKNNWYTLSDIPEEFKDYNMYLTAVENYGGALKYVPEELKDYKICLAAVENNGDALKYVPEKLKDYNICLTAVKKYGYALEIVPEEFKDYKLCLATVENNGYALEIVPEEFKDYKLCLAAVKNYGDALKYVPEELKDYKICLAAVENNGDALIYVPEKYRDYKLCLTAVENNGYLLKYVPEELKDYNICSTAVENDWDALKYVPEKLKHKIENKLY